MFLAPRRGSGVSPRVAAPPPRGCSAAAPRPADDRADRRRAVRARDAAEGALRRAAAVFQHVGAPLLGLFPFVSMFVVTSVTMLRERTSGTLERLMTMPLAQARPARRLRGRLRAARGRRRRRSSRLLAFGLLGLRRRRAARGRVVALAVANAMLGMALGLFVSAFATDRVPGGAVHAGDRASRSCCSAGCFVARATWPDWLRDRLGRAAADLRVRRAREGGAREGRTARGSPSTSASSAARSLLALALGAATLKRRTPNQLGLAASRETPTPLTAMLDERRGHDRGPRAGRDHVGPEPERPPPRPGRRAEPSRPARRDRRASGTP